MHSSDSPDEAPSPSTDDFPPISESSAPAARSEPSPTLPVAIGPYKILSLLGEGGMGVVYLAEQEQLRRRVALKVLKQGVAHPERSHRFEREIEALAQLQHEGIARIHEAGRIGEGDRAQPYFVMEFVDGCRLTVHAQRQRLDIRQRLRLMVRVCQAVQEAHWNGVVHRDLKPANILVGKDGQPKVVDFGVALITHGDRAIQTLQTVVGQLVGTVPYMSPEQAQADPGKIDWRSDIYALGVICYELLAGKLPHDLKDKPVLSAVRIICEEEPTPLSSIGKSFRGDLSTIVAKALEKDKTQRYQSAEALAADLEHYLRDEPITARPASAVYKFRKFAKRHPARLMLGGIVLLVIIAGIVLGPWVVIQRERRARLEAERFAEIALRANQHGHWRVALTNFDKALHAGYADPVNMRLGKIRALLELNKVGLCAEVIDELDKMPNRAQHEGSVLLLLGEMKLGQNDAEAEQLFGKALDNDLSPSERAYARGLLAETTPEAIEYFRETLRNDPYHYRARVSLEFLLLFLAQFDEAKRELRAHEINFPDDKALLVLQTLLPALEGKRDETKKPLSYLKDHFEPADLAALEKTTAFLCEFRNRANPPDEILGIPLPGNHWDAVQPALRHLWPALVDNGRAKPPAPPRLLLISRLPPRLRNNLEGLPRFLIEMLGNNADLMRIVEELNRYAEIHPEGTIFSLRAMALLSTQQHWQEASQAAEKAAETPALLPVKPAALNVAAMAKVMLYFLFDKRPEPYLYLRAAEAALLMHRPAFSAAAAAHLAHQQILLRRAVANLKELLAQEPHRPLQPENAVKLAILADEFNLARQLLDDWAKSASKKELLTIWGLRARIEDKAGAYGQALKAANKYFDLKPDNPDPEMRNIKEESQRKLKEEMHRLFGDAPERR